MQDLKVEKGLRDSIIDGAFSAVMGSLAGGIFLMGFALKILKASPQQIGILASLPMIANLTQIFGSYLIEKFDNRKKICFLGVVFARILWIFIILLPLQLFASFIDWKIWVVVCVIGISSLFASLSGIAWISWMSDLVPEKIRGSYFGKRNMISSICGMVAILMGGKFISFWEDKFSLNNPYGFVILFCLGLTAGLIATWFLFKVPEVKYIEKEKKSDFNYSLFLKPFKDKNFRILTFFAASWIFSIQLAGPFYGVFMINNLDIDFSVITFFGTLATLATLLMMKIWGKMSDVLGNKPIIIVSGLVLVFVPFIWSLAVIDNYYVPVLIAHLLSGMFMAGVSLSQFNILIKLSPKQGRSVYLALVAAITGTIGATAPIVGGFIMETFKEFSFNFFIYNIQNIHILFMCSAVLQLLTLTFIIKVKEPAASTPVAVIMQLKNDLNPQTGVASTADIVMMEVQRGTRVLKRIDDFTEKIAEKSEQKIESFLDKVIEFFKDIFIKITGRFK